MPESEAEINDQITETDSKNSEKNDSKLLDASADHAIEQYRKLRENTDEELTEKQMAEIDKECEIIKNREIITQDTPHKRVEIVSKDGTVITGPPTLT